MHTLTHARLAADSALRHVHAQASRGEPGHYHRHRTRTGHTQQAILETKPLKGNNHPCNLRRQQQHCSLWALEEILWLQALLGSLPSGGSVCSKSITDLKVLAGRLDGALIEAVVLCCFLAVWGFLQVQLEGRRRLPHLRPAGALGPGGSRRPAAGGDRGGGLGDLSRPSLSWEGAQIDLHSH